MLVNLDSLPPFLRNVQSFRRGSSYFRHLGCAEHLSSQDQQQKQTEWFLGDATLLPHLLQGYWLGFQLHILGVKSM